MPETVEIPDCDPEQNVEDCIEGKQGTVTDEVIKWVSYIGGVLLGGLVEFVANWDQWPCLSDIAKLLENAYLIYFYIASYVQTGDA